MQIHILEWIDSCSESGNVRFQLLSVGCRAIGTIKNAHSVVSRCTIVPNEWNQTIILSLLGHILYVIGSGG
jgi:hypothetical protein